MKILGIDPGVANTGFGIIEVKNQGVISIIHSGIISTSPKEEHGLRLQKIYNTIVDIINKYRPDVIAVESIFYSRNLKSLVEVSEAIGVITLAAYKIGISIKKFTPLEVKAAVTGFGKASKSQIQMMVGQILGLENYKCSNHESDALAVAICYKNIYNL